MKPMTIHGLWVAALVTVLMPAGLEAAGGSSTPAPTPSLSPQDEARTEYESGLRHRDKAWKLEEKAAASGDAAERDKLAGKVRKEFQKAERAFRRATLADPSMFQAFGSLGYALRRLGNYDESLAAYNRALELEPGYTEAIEYRAEAYLGLNRLDEAKQAYLELFRSDRERADELMAAMQKWVAERTAEPGALDRATIDAFSAWVEERARISGHTARLTGSGAASW